jgi:hypothetical protein
MKASDVYGIDTSGKDYLFEDADVTEARLSLLSDAFEGHSLRVVKDPLRHNAPTLIVAHNSEERHIDVILTELDLLMLEQDFAAYKRRIATPMLNCLNEG